MKFKTRTPLWIATPIAVALTVVACGGSDGDDLIVDTKADSCSVLFQQRRGRRGGLRGRG
ncbi:MAG: hypothetical protein QM777_24215 [Pseudorhodoferax sp.]